MPAPDLPSGLQVLERGWLSANSVVFTGGEQTAVIDSGYHSHAVQTVSLLQAALAGRALDLLINTHLHSDHCGGNAALQAHYPALQTVIPPGHARQVAQWDAAALGYIPTGQLCPQFRFEETLQPGTAMRLGQADWQIHAAPGHDPHSVIFFEPASKTLISADALWENGFGVVFPELDGADAFDEVAATLDLIEKLAPAVVIPGHGRVFAYRPDILLKSRQRLDSFVSDPLRHARHAVKVLLKFKLLEVQRQPLAQFTQWAMDTAYFELIRQRFFLDIPLQPWIDQLRAELVSAGVARQEGPDIVNA
ncbi:MAG: MBL fold metallo-hydrolase [Pseudomonadota bacterium]|nr:MBL fold metallo-hydrolase [Pseudomonadota bacterium]